ncbi:MAG: iron uptake porin [Pseudanabaenaceae cyanobacterium bins.68]|nr:iron uptake porin [Pseudanabaenaceae cyanobacterium bins.68]
MNKLNLTVGLIGCQLVTGSLVILPGWADTQVKSDATRTAEAIQSLNLESNPDHSAEEVAQVTAVSQLSDVKTTDWAFTALQSLVERYGCIAGYPDRTFRGQRSLSRYEFAAGLNACLDKVNELLTAGLADKVSQADLAALQRLQEEFATELAALKQRVTGLEGKVAKLEAQQFSTTTKLEGQAIFALSGAATPNSPFFSSGITGNDGRTANSIADSGTNTVALGRVRLNLNTTFNGNDLLFTRLEAGNGGGTAAAVLGNLPAGNAGNLGFATFGSDYAGSPTTVSLTRLRYDFNLTPDLRLSIGPLVTVNDHIDANSYANNESVDFSSTFFINNPLIVAINGLKGGAGAVANWNPGQGAFTLRALYVAANGADPTRGAGENANGIVSNRGLTGDPYQGSFELEFAPKTKDGEKGPFAIKLQYTNASVSNLDLNFGGVNLEWAFSKGVAVFGRYGFGSIGSRGGVAVSNNPGLFNLVNTGASGTSLSPQTWMAGLAFPDLFKPGAMAAIAVGQPFIESQVGNSTQTNLELFYNFPISKNITITPDLQFIFNPNNNNANNSVFVGTLRTVFSF